MTVAGDEPLLLVLLRDVVELFRLSECLLLLGLSELLLLRLSQLLRLGLSELESL